MICEITKKMIEYSNGNLHDINHFMKVYAYAKTIGQCEKIDESTQAILEAAALVHDIACHYAEKSMEIQMENIKKKREKSLQESF